MNPGPEASVVGAHLHCGHVACCQCGAKLGTPERERACPDSVVMAMIRARPGGSRKIAPHWARTLAANLSIGAGLCASFGLGTWNTELRIRSESNDPWRPGCGRSAR